MLKKSIKWLLILLVLVSAAVTLYGWHLSGRIEKRFSARLWRVPSTVYSDTTLLYPGQGFDQKNLTEKLKSLGYRTVTGRPNNQGEMRMTKGSVEVYLNDFKIPSQHRPGHPVRLRFDGGHIKSIERIDTGDRLPVMELEPEEIGQFYGPERERRQLVSIRQVPPKLVRAVMAAEDSRFYGHHGFDPVGILRAFYINLRAGRIRQGGSTITQQLAKNFFLTPERTIVRKLNELIMSVIIELKYQKEEILEIYLNDIYLGQSGTVAINGVGEACLFYFAKPVKDISLAEAATIAGLIRAPGRYSPYIDKERCRQRRDTVLKAMSAKNWISGSELQSALAQPIETVGENVVVKKAPYFMDYLSHQLESLYSPDDLTRLGLSIYTTLDTRVQDAAEHALYRGLTRLEKSIPPLKRTDPAMKLQGAVIVMQPKTGFILAMVGGRDYAASQYNRVTQSRRQPGSAFKPFIYLAALDQLTPATRLSNEPRTYMIDGKPWTPENAAQEVEGNMSVSMRTALAASNNRATVDLAMKTGLEQVVEKTAPFQFSTPIKPYPSLALGAFEVVPLELARAYCVLAGDGVLPHPLSIKDVTDDHGRLMSQAHLNIERLISPAKAYVMTDMLKSVVSEGTARALSGWNLPGPVAGKTGTTNNFRDAWFVGYTPDILALVWVGFDNGDPVKASGAKAALPIWAELMKAIPQYISGADFKMPAGVVTRTVCSESGLLSAGRTCPVPMEEIFLEDNVPDQPCPLHPARNPIKDLIDGIKDLFNGSH
ncbi:MAG: PBP1A family penicillin-binding protein [Desulfobacterales bacterium]